MNKKQKITKNIELYFFIIYVLCRNNQRVTGQLRLYFGDGLLRKK